MQELWIGLIFGLIVGWLVEWIIDWRYWRRSMGVLRAENAKLRRQLAAGEPGDAPPMQRAATGSVSTPGETH